MSGYVIVTLPTHGATVSASAALVDTRMARHAAAGHDDDDLRAAIREAGCPGPDPEHVHERITLLTILASHDADLARQKGPTHP